MRDEGNPTEGSTSALSRRLSGVLSLAASALVFGPSFLVSCLVVPLDASYRFGAVELGIVWSAFYVTGCVSAWVAGRTVDRIGARMPLVGACALTAISCAGIAISGSWHTIAWMFALSGIGAGFVPPAAVRLLVSTVAPSKRGIALAIRQSAAPFAAILIGVFTAATQAHVGWRSMFWGYALLSAVLAVLSVRWAREGNVVRASADHGRMNVDTIVLVISGTCLLGAAVSIFAGFVVTTGIAVGMTPESAGLVLALSSAVAIVARLFTGWSADRRSGGHLIRVAALMLLGGLSCVVVGFASAPALFVAAAVAVSVTAWSSNALFFYAVINRQAHAPARAASMLQLGMFAGSAVGPSLFGYALEHGNSRAAWMLPAAMLLAASGLVLWARRTLLRARRS